MAGGKDGEALKCKEVGNKISDIDGRQEMERVRG